MRTQQKRGAWANRETPEGPDDVRPSGG